MGEFFEGWRRKIGCLTLMMSWIAAMLWVRSFDVDQFGHGDFLILGTSMYDCLTIHSRSGMFEFARPQESANGTPDYFRVPYWTFVVPLTVVSSWLLLSKPRSPIHVQKTLKSTPVTGT